MKSFKDSKFEIDDRVVLKKDVSEILSALSNYENIRFKVIAVSHQPKSYLLYIEEEFDIPKERIGEKKFTEVWDSYVNDKLFGLNKDRIVTCDINVIEKDIRYTRDNLINELLKNEL